MTIKIPRSSYYDKHYRPSPALLRARQPYLIKNTITGVCIFAFTIGVYSWTINAVSQDDFSDVPIPDAPAQPPHTPHAGFERADSPAGLEQRREATLNRR